jgi:hypothetical protein
MWHEKREAVYAHFIRIVRVCSSLQQAVDKSDVATAAAC